MRTLGAAATAAVASAYKKVSWLFTVVDADANTYYWSTKVCTEGGHNYLFRVIAFDGVEMVRNKSEFGIIAPSSLRFTVSNTSGTTYTPTDFIDGSVTLELKVSDGTNNEVIRTWKYIIKNVEPRYGSFTIVAVDILADVLKGDYPNTKLVRDLFKTTDTDNVVKKGDQACVPVTYGTAYVPIRSVYIADHITLTTAKCKAVQSSEGSRCRYEIVDETADFMEFEVGRYVTVDGFTSSQNDGTFLVLRVTKNTLEVSDTAGLANEAEGDTITFTEGSRFYLLGADGTYTISEVRSPRTWGRKSTWTENEQGSEWQTNVQWGGNREWWVTATFLQEDISDGTNTYTWLQPIIADSDNDGVYDAPGVWRSGESFLDMPCKFSKSTTASTTNPADVLLAVLEDMGVAAADLDSATTFAAADTTYTGWGLTWNGAFWYKEPRKTVLSRLLLQCHSQLYVGEQVELHTISKSPVKAVDISDIMEGSFSFTDVSRDSVNDGGYVAWQKSGESQDQFITTLVPTKAGATPANISGEIIQMPFVQDSQDVQALGTLYFQRKYEIKGQVNFKSKATLLAIDPGDMIAIAGGLHPVASATNTSKKEVAREFYDMVLDPITVTNGGFETIAGGDADDDGVGDNFTNWTEQHYAVSGGLNEATATHRSGSRALKQILGTGTTPYVYYVWTCSAGACCKVTIWTMCDTASLCGRIRVYDITNSVYLETTSVRVHRGYGVTTTWEKFVTYVWGASNSASYRILLVPAISASAYVYWDDLTIDEVRPVMVDRMKINRDCSIEFNCTLFDVVLDDFGDITPSAVTPDADDTTEAWGPSLAGPGANASCVVESVRSEKTYITVSPTDQSNYSSIHEALNALSGSNAAGLYIKNGTYGLDAAIYLPDRDIDILGESEAGVQVHNYLATSAFIMENKLRRKYYLSNFTINSANQADGGSLIYIHGTTAPQMTSDVTIDKMTLNLWDNNTHAQTGDKGIYGLNSDGSIRISRVTTNRGCRAIHMDDVDKVEIQDCTIIEPIYYGISLDTCLDFSVTNNVMRDIWENGIDVVQDSGVVVKGVITGNRIHGKNDSSSVLYMYPIYVTYCQLITISGNSINWPCSRTGALVASGITLSSSYYAVVNDNNVYMYSSMSGGAYMIGAYLVGGQCTCVGNSFVQGNDNDTSYNSGVLVSGDHNVVCSNFLHNIYTRTYSYGVWLPSGSDSNVVVGNRCVAAGTAVLDSGAGNVVEHNL